MDAKKRELAARMAELFALPMELAAGLCHVELLGDSGFFMEGHDGILAYGEEEIDVNAPGMVVRVTGSALHLRAMTQREVHIAGKIDAVQFLR